MVSFFLYIYKYARNPYALLILMNVNWMLSIDGQYSCNNNKKIDDRTLPFRLVDDNIVHENLWFYLKNAKNHICNDRNYQHWPIDEDRFRWLENENV